MTETKKLFSATGTLRVKARGYWFTSGGDKGSFGYYPHLKDENDYPVFPDTQIYGDLRMSATWLNKLNHPDKLELAEKEKEIQSIFGKEGAEQSSMLFISDLRLSNPAISKDVRFEVKPRIEIDDETRTVKKHMLVNLEMSYLEGVDLIAEVYLGYFDEAKLISAKELLKSSAEFLSGFGAFRSRGYGRGTVELKWEEKDKEFNFEEAEVAPLNIEQVIFLKNLVNFRNKPVELGSYQIIDTHYSISSEQLRGWFVRTYNRIFKDEWPTPDQMALITFPDLHPSILNKDAALPGYPVPMTTLKNEKGEVVDLFGREDDEMLDADNLQGSFFSSKTKPLPAGSFVTNETVPSVIAAKSEKRIRNSIVDNFTTKKEGGLFVQELVRKETLFGGILRIKEIKDGKDKDFLKRASFILMNVNPVINGCIFKREEKAYKADTALKQALTRLVISSRPYNPQFINHGTYVEKVKNGNRKVVRGDANQISLDTVRRYNTTLKRPRRPRIVISPGSVIFSYKETKQSELDYKTLLDWSGFGEKLRPASEADIIKKTNKTEETTYDFKVPDGLNGLSKSHTGFLREFLNDKRTLDEISKVVRHRIEKYEKKGSSEHLELLYKKIEGYIGENDEGEKMRAFINFTLDRLAEQRWETRQKK